MAGWENCECGLAYSPLSPRDRAQHRRWHDEFVNGAHARPLADDEVVVASGELRIVLVRPDSSFWQRSRIEKIGRRANRDTRYDFPVYSAWNEANHKLELHAFAAYLDDRGIALLLLGRRSTIWTAGWRNGRVVILEPEPAKVFRWTVGFVWVLPQFRRRGFATGLLQEASRFAEVPLEELAWFAPFSDEGALLVRHWCPERLWLGE
jgi:hypothetical protein